MMQKLFGWVVQAFWILFFYGLGTGVSFLTGGMMPGSVLGMLFLFGALALGWVRPSSVDKLSELLMRNMMLFFLPATVGLITTLGLVARNIIPIAAATIISTLIVMGTVGLLAQKMERNPKVRAWQRAVFKRLHHLGRRSVS